MRDGNASSGGIMPPAYLPAWLRPLSEILPVGVGVRALQGVSRFQDDGLASALVILPVWVLGAALILYLKDVFRSVPRTDAGANGEARLEST